MVRKSNHSLLWKKLAGLQKMLLIKLKLQNTIYKPWSRNFKRLYKKAGEVIYKKFLKK